MARDALWRSNNARRKQLKRKNVLHPFNWIQIWLTLKYIFLISAKICAGIIDRKPNNKIQNMQPESQNDFDDIQRK